MNAAGTVPRPRRAGPLPAGMVIDIAIAAGAALIQVGGTALAAHGQHGVRPLDWVGYLLLAVDAGVLVGRRRWPVTVYLLTFAATFAYALLNYPGGPIWAGLIVAFVTLLGTAHRMIAYASLAVGYVAFLWLVKLVNDQPTPSPALAVGIAAWMLFLAAVTELVRNRRAYVQANRQRELEKARMVQEAARRQASEQRLAIARELHDVLAHSLSLINVQAGVALELMDQRPKEVRTALDAIKRTSRDALVDVQAVLASLRRADERAPLTPAATLRDLDELVRQAEVAGLAVQVTVSGPLNLPAAVDAAAYRIVQEALTNVIRHADATHVTIRLTEQRSQLTVTVEDDGRGRGADVPARNGCGGEGIPGMCARAVALGGQLQAGPRPGRGFQVTAAFPLPVDAEAAAP